LGLKGDLSKAHYATQMQPVCSTGAMCCEWWPFSTSWPADQDVLSGGNAFGLINVIVITSVFVIYFDSLPCSCIIALFFIIPAQGTIFRIYRPCKLQVRSRYNDHKLQGVNSVIPAETGTNILTPRSAFHQQDKIYPSMYCNR